MEKYSYHVFFLKKKIYSVIGREIANCERHVELVPKPAGKSKATEKAGGIRENAGEWKRRTVEK